MFARTGRMPTKEQAAVYASVRHYLKAVAATGTDDPDKVGVRMREMPVDYLGHAGSIRPDGRVLYDMTLYRVKKPVESRYPWDYYTAVKTLPKETIFRPVQDGGCGLVAPR